MNNFEIIFYERENGDVPVENFLLSLDCKMRAKLIGIINILTRREQEIPLLYREGTEKVDNTVYIWYNVSIKYRRCFYDRTTAEIGTKSIHGNI